MSEQTPRPAICACWIGRGEDTGALRERRTCRVHGDGTAWADGHEGASWLHTQSKQPPTPPVDPWKEIVEKMRSRAMVAGQCSVEEPEDRCSAMAASEAEFLARRAEDVDAARALDAAYIERMEKALVALVTPDPNLRNAAMHHALAVLKERS